MLDIFINLVRVSKPIEGTEDDLSPDEEKEFNKLMKHPKIKRLINLPTDQNLDDSTYDPADECNKN